MVVFLFLFLFLSVLFFLKRWTGWRWVCLCSVVFISVCRVSVFAILVSGSFLKGIQFLIYIYFFASELFYSCLRLLIA